MAEGTTAAVEKVQRPTDTHTVHSNEIIVRAPRIRGQLNVPQQPIEVLDEEDIAAYGVNSIDELIDAISPQTNSGRGRGDGRPVILVNGQRITNFREIHNIPPEAIRRLEVLPEEVALRFGYPPNQRVVNIILKDQFAAANASGEYNRPTRGGYDNYQLETGLFNVSGPRRYNVTVKLDETSMLTEAERGVIWQPSPQQMSLPRVAGDPDPARYTSLAGSDRVFSVEGTMTQGLGENGLGGSITMSGGYTHSLTVSLSGLDTVPLTYDGGSVLRTLPDPLATQGIADKFEGGLGFSKMLGTWQFNLTGDGSYTETDTFVDRRRTARNNPAVAALVASAAAGTHALDGVLPSVPGSGVDRARNRALTVTNLATLSGAPFRLPAGDASLTVKVGYEFDQTSSNSTRNALGTVTLRRGDLSGGVNLALPLTSRDFLGAVGAVTLNFSGGLDRLSDFGTLTDWSAGLTWSPTNTLTLQASYLVNEAAPTLAQLGAPMVLTDNVTVYDFARQTTALVTVTSGGNADLVAEKQRDIKLSATWRLPFLQRSNLIVEYFHNRSTDVSQAFPLLTPAIEAAFPGRVTRDEGNLTAIDQRAVTFDEVSSSRLRWGFNFSGSLGGGGGASDRGSAGQEKPSPVRGMPVQSAIGPNGPMPGAPSQAGAVPRHPFDPARFAALRQLFCMPGGSVPDISNLPEGLRVRLAGPDGKVDPKKLARFKARACSPEESGGGPGERGGFDPERFARMRALLCGESPPDLAALPERMAERLRGPDGKIDQARLAEVRQRMCAAGGPPPPGGSADGPPPPPDAGAGTGRADGGAMTGGGHLASGGPGGPSGFGGGRGGGGMGPGGGPPMMMGGRGGRGSRWNISIYHTWRFTDRVQLAPGMPVLNELAGDAITVGGVPRHSIEAEGGLFKNGYGLRLKAEWDAPARVNGGSSSLRFGSTLNVSLRLFADLGRNEDIVSKVPFLKGSRVAFKVDNLLDWHQRVTDQNGVVPAAYQAAFRNPQGAVIGIDFRKMF